MESFERGWALALAGALVGCGAAPESEPAEQVDDAEAAATPGTGTVFGTGGLGLNVREAASTTSPIVGKVKEGTKVGIECQRTGDQVGGSSVWNFLPAWGGYVADAYVWTGHDGFIPGVPKCSDGGSSTPSGGALVVRGVKLSANQDQWMRHVAEKIVPEMRGTRAQRIDKASYVTWWSLKEGVLGLPNPLAYSNCHFPPDTKIGPLEVCPNPNNAWQVGISGVQAAWRTLADVEWLASQVHPNETMSQILAGAATAAGYGPNTSTGGAIATSTGRLRLSWLLRDGAVGYEAQHPTVVGECFTTCKNGWESTCAWCFGKGWAESAAFAPDRASAQLAVGDIAAILDDLAP